MTIGDKIRYQRKRLKLTQTELGEKLGVKTNAVSKWECGRVEDIPTSKIKAMSILFDVPASYLIDEEVIHKEKEQRSLPSNISPIPQIKNTPQADRMDGGESQPYSSEAMQLAKDYDGLDGHGQRVVRLVADEELARCAEEDKVKQARAAAVQKQKRQMEAAEEMVCFIVPWFFMPMSAGTGEIAGDEQPENLRLTREPPKGTSYVAPVSGDSMEPTFQNGDKLFIHACTEIRTGQIGVFFMDGQQWVKELGDGVLLSHNPAYPPIPMRDGIECQGLVLGVCDESYFK